MKNHYNKILALFGLIILSYILYNRLFRIRLPKEIVHTNNSFVISLYALLCITALILVIANIYLFTKIILNKPEPVENNNIILRKIIVILQSKYNPFKFMSDSLLALDIYIKNKIPRYDDHRDYLDVVVMFLGNLFWNYNEIFLFIFISIPIIFQSIVLSSLFVDVFIYGKFYYFYKYLWVLIFPLIANYILHSIRALIETNLNSLDKVLYLRIVKAEDFALENMNAPMFEISVHDWRDIAANTPPGFYICINCLSKEYRENNPMFDHARILEYCIDSMNEFFIVQKFLDNYTELKNNFLIPFKIIKYFIYALCWVYVLFLIF